MQKIINQNLGGSEEQAKEKAEYTWVKGETAWLFESITRDVCKVEFTGEHWLIGNKWGREKIYQFLHLENSSDSEFAFKGISHDSEDSFFTTKKEALDRGYNYIGRVREDALKQFNQDSKRLMEYAKK